MKPQHKPWYWDENVLLQLAVLLALVLGAAWVSMKISLLAFY